MAEPQLPTSNANVAYRGRLIKLDKYENQAPLPKSADLKLDSELMFYEPTQLDYTDLTAITIEIVKLRERLHKIRIQSNKANRIAIGFQYEYQQHKRRVLIGLSGGSEKQREAIAEVENEELYGKWAVAKAAADEYAQLSRDTRLELDALKEISNNMRRLIDLN